MTPKQEEFLEKYLSEQQIARLNKENFKTISNFIGMIIATKNFNFKKEITLDKSIVKNLGDIVNKNRRNYNCAEDEYCSCTNMYILKGFNLKVFRFEQKWFKGMSNSPSYHWFFVLEDGSKYPGVYQVMFDKGVRTIEQLLEKLYEDESC